jgi:V8-like Glu-specific endopeptidase
MSWDTLEFSKRLKKEVDTYDREAAAALCDRLVEHLSEGVEPYPEAEALGILNLLRRKRMFALMEKVADALIQAGQETYQIRRQYAQSLIDQGNMTAANAVLDALIADSGADASEKAAKENAEARGLKGRAHKQLYINAKDRTSERVRAHLRRAVNGYSAVYTSAPAKHLWHGINVVALLMLAEREGVDVEGFPTPRKTARGLARKILKVIEGKKDAAQQWDFATAVEACVALDKSAEAEGWLGRYVKAQYEDPDQYADAFEIASTLRQFEEVWQLDINSEMGRRILPVLRAELLKREGCEVRFSPEDLRPENGDPFPDGGEYQAVYGNAAFDSYQSLRVGMARARAVARIQQKNAGGGGGTGFVVKGSELNAGYGDGLVLLTNAHVVSDDPEVRLRRGALHPSEASVTFEALGAKTYKVKELLWTSPPHELDATILRLDEQLDETDLYPLAEVLPVVSKEARVYIIGHPDGGSLSYSIQDNLLIGHRHPPGFIHYRTPTKPGSSGSPVFNRDWDLIGLHHKGRVTQGLNEKPEGTEANEGIWIRAIIEAIAKSRAG